VSEVKIAMPYQDQLSFAPGAHPVGENGTSMGVASSCANATAHYAIKILAPTRGPTITGLGSANPSAKALSTGAAQVYAIHDRIRTHRASVQVTARHLPLER
jgi:hypothetical protein